MLIDIMTGKPLQMPMNLTIGTKIRYIGDMANFPGVGAVVDVQPCKYYGKDYTIALEDGRMWNCSPASFSGGPGCRMFVTPEPPATAEEIAALYAANAFLNAKTLADKTAADQSFAANVEKIQAENPSLEQGNGPVVAAKNIRKMLKAAFPGVKFSVTTSRYSGGNSIYIRWTNGPEAKDVEAIADRFEAGSFNGTDDSYTYTDSPWNVTFGSARYVFAMRNKEA